MPSGIGSNEGTGARPAGRAPAANQEDNMSERMTTEHGRYRRRGSTVRMLRTVGDLPVGIEGRIVDARPHGQGVQYLVDALTDTGSLVEWVGGRFVGPPRPRRRVRRSA